MANPDQDARNRYGRYHRTPEKVARDAEAARLYYDEQLTYRQIADHFGWAHHSSAMDAVNRALKEAAAPTKGVRERRERELQLLWDTAMEILNSEHLTVSHGQIVRLDGEPIPDNGPRIQALNQLIRINAELRKLHGTDAAVKVDATVHEVTQQDLELQEMLREAKASAELEEQKIRDGGDT